MIFLATVYDEDDRPHIAEVHWEWTRPRAATRFQPEEGGYEFGDVRCATMKLTQHDIEDCEQQCIDAQEALTR